MPSNSVIDSHKARRVLRITGKILVRTLLSVILLLLIVIALIQFPAIQNYLKNKIVTTLTEKLQTTVKLGYIRINFGGSLVLENLFIADRQQDTVINAGKIKVAVNPAGLLSKKVIVSNILLSGTSFNYLVLDSAGRTNLDFIINSFSGGEKEEKPQTKSAWDIQIKKVQLDKSNLVYQNLNDSMNFNLKLGKLIVNVSKNNLDSLSFDVERILIQDTRASLTYYNLVDKVNLAVKTEKESEKADAAKGLSVSIKKLDLLAVTFQQTDSLTGSGGTFNIGEAHIIPRNIDLTNQIIDIASIQLQKGNINYRGSTSASTTKTPTEEQVPAKDGSSWKINLDNGNLSFDKIRLSNLVPAEEGSLDYLTNISLSNIKIDIAATLNNSKSWNFNLKSLRFEDDRTSRLVSLVVTASSDGKRMKLSPFNFRLGKSHIAGMAEGVFSEGKDGVLPDFNANITSSNLIITDFVPYLPKSLYPNLKRIPSQLIMFAELHSRNQVLHGNGELRSDEGNIRFTAQMDQGSASSYKFNVELNEVDGGFFAQNQQLGKLSATINASGSGFKPESMLSDVALLIPYINYNGVTYKNIKLDGNINQGLISATLATNDPIAKLVMNVEGKMGDQPEFKVNSHIQNLDLYAMKLLKDTMALSGIIDASYMVKGKGRFEAFTDTLLINLRKPNEEINTDSKLSYSVLGDTVEARVKSNFGNIAYDGNIPLQEVAGVMKNYFEQYFSDQKADSAQNSSKFFKVAVNVDDLSMLNDFMALNIDVPEKAQITAELKYNRLISNVDIKKIIFNEIEIDNLVLDASGKDSAFHVDFTTAAIHNNVHTLRDISLQSNLRHGNLESRLELSNSESKKWFNLGASMQPRNPELNVIIREPLMLNHQEWSVDENNRTYIMNNNIVFSNVKLNSGNKLISLLSDARQPEKLAVLFKNLDLAFLSEVLNGDTTFISGKIDGELMTTNLFAKPVPVFDAKLGISNIIVEKRPLGELNVAASNIRNNDIADLDVNFGQQDMKFNLNGTYGLKKDIPMDLDLITQNLSLAAIQPLIKDLISDASGAVNASLKIKGNFSAPDINGQIGFDKASAFVEPIQAKFLIDNQQIRFRGDGVDFNKFIIKDADGSNLEINGKVALANLKNLNYNLNIKSDKFLAYQGPPDNLPGQDNRVIITSDIKFTGENITPQVNATIRIDEGSRFFYKITKQASTLTEEGIIEFVGAGKAEEEEEKVPETSVVENLSLTANISVANNTAVRIITDPVRNLGLNMEAGGIFTMNQRPYQSPRLTGRLDISGGDYTISLSGLKRKFQIADSSFIVWYGNISKPELNLRAFYEVRTTPPAEVVGNTGTLPFMVNMIISGSLEDPKFNFRLSLPREYENAGDGLIAAKLQEINSNESELNQKAMTLLLFGSFGFDNFANVFSGSSGANVIISNALNQFAAQKIEFVDLHFDLESYDNYGGNTEDNLRTELEIAASKKLADDRVNVQLGATVVLQADEQEQQKSLADKISPEFNIQYMLNKPRTLSIRTFRQSEYRGLVEGKVISTGAGILFQKDFNKFSELFVKKPDDSEPVAEIQNDVNEKE